MGDLSELTIKILFLFLPGIIYCILIHKFTFRPKKEFNMFFLYSFIFGFGIYALYAFIQKIFFKVPTIHFFDYLFTTPKTFNYEEIAFVSMLAIALAFIYSWFSNQRILYNLNAKITNSAFIQRHLPTYLSWYKIMPFTKKFDRIDVWNEIFDMPDQSYHWVLITDYDVKLKYEGWVSKFSDNVKDNELFLRDVIVYGIEDNELYRTPALYISRKSDNITIEFFRVKPTKHYYRYKSEKGGKNVKQRREKSQSIT